MIINLIKLNKKQAMSNPETNQPNKCTEIARFLVPWSGEILKRCPYHTKGLQVLADVIDLHLQPILLERNSSCICDSTDQLIPLEAAYNEEFNTLYP